MPKAQKVQSQHEVIETMAEEKVPKAHTVQSQHELIETMTGIHVNAVGNQCCGPIDLAIQTFMTNTAN